MRWLALILGITLLVALPGCMGKDLNLFMDQPDNQKAKEIVFPNGTVVGGAASDQAQALAQILVDSHNLHMKEFGELKKQSAAQAEEAKKNRETAEQALAMIQKLAQSQGSGEITIFFRTGSAKIPASGLEFERLVRFADFVSRESKNRKVHFVLIGSASATGNPKWNLKLSQKRAKAPIDIIDKYLVNVPHDYYQISAVGDMYAPKDVERKVNRRYQNVRIIAFFATDQLPELPEGVKAE